MSIAVVIPVYNGGEFIAAAIDSVLAQSVAVDEIIVIDDGSTDNTAQVLKAYADINYCYQANAGVSAARNKGIEIAQSDFIALLDQDDVFPVQKIAVSLQAFKHNPQLEVVRGRWQYIFADESTAQEFSTYTPPTIASCNFLVGSALFKRQVFTKVGGFDESLTAAEDVDLWFRLAAMNIVIHDIDALCLYYRQHGHNTTRSAGFAARNAKNTLRILHQSLLLRRKAGAN